MAKTCPSCGTPAADDEARFCNKCGYPFPKTRPDNRTIVSRADNRLYETHASEYEAAPHQPRTTPGKKPGRECAATDNTLPFMTRMVKNHQRLIYIIGAVVIILISLLGISAGFSTTGTDSAVKSLINTSALLQNPTTSPLFWIGFLVFGSLVWRIFCDLIAMVFRMYDAMSGGDDESLDDGAEEYHEEADEGMYECPHCGKVVPASQLRQCEHCGVQGCSNCIRMMGLIKKTMTCRECFENK
ncbi:MAG: DUF4282 domain-containing protein [Methanoregula sp.]|uniref:DUF4282 domain-containing protein n=1 Tax=Methanoregula sp. TaxID=2052170 RepID=UPI0025E35296|nr:DUF4282 domain-containing protein [Methanoregula sp.]MCK9631650.1 DUF4282 domain-containing protein [Methanoregula sp.]